MADYSKEDLRNAFASGFNLGLIWNEDGAADSPEATDQDVDEMFTDAYEEYLGKGKRTAPPGFVPRIRSRKMKAKAKAASK